MHTEFVALLAHADLSQAGFARLAGVTARQVNNWARGRARVPQWATLLAIALEELTPELLTIMLDEVDFSWPEVLGVAATADATTARRAMTQLALRYHPDKGGAPEQMVRINAAYEAARKAINLAER